MNEEPGCYSDAQRYCLAEYPWVVSTARRVSKRRGLPYYGEDIAQEVFRKAKGIKDDFWANRKNKKGYFARMIINKANDLCHLEHGFEPLADHVLASTPAQTMEAAILIKELINKLSTDEQRLLEHIFLGYSGAEIAKSLGTNCPTARKRISRLMEKLSSLGQGDDYPSPTRETRARTC